MKCVIQRVNYATCTIDNKLFSQIGKGLLVLVGFSDLDNEEIIENMVNKILNLRILSDNSKTLSFSTLDLQTDLMLIPNFTLYANTKKGNRPSFIEAGNKDDSKIKYYKMLELFEKSKLNIGRGLYSADMQINLENDGPVTIIIDSSK